MISVSNKIMTTVKNVFEKISDVVVITRALFIKHPNMGLFESILKNVSILTGDEISIDAIETMLFLGKYLIRGLRKVNSMNAMTRGFLSGAGILGIPGIIAMGMSDDLGNVLMYNGGKFIKKSNEETDVIS